MDRLAWALILLTLAGTLWGGLRWRQSAPLLAEAQRLEQEHRAAALTLAVTTPPVGPRLLPLAQGLFRLAEEVEAARPVLRLSARLTSRSAGTALVAPLQAEPVELAIPLDAGPLPVLEWLRVLPERLPFLITKLSWDGKALTVQGLVLGQ